MQSDPKKSLVWNHPQDQTGPGQAQGQRQASVLTMAHTSTQENGNSTETPASYGPMSTCHPYVLTSVPQQVTGALTSQYFNCSTALSLLSCQLCCLLPWLPFHLLQTSPTRFLAAAPLRCSSYPAQLCGCCFSTSSCSSRLGLYQVSQLDHWKLHQLGHLHPLLMQKAGWASRKDRVTQTSGFLWTHCNIQ